MRGRTLVKLLDLYRAECRLSLNPAHNSQARDAQVHHIQRTQEWLWTDYDWPLLRVERFFGVANGQRYYSLPADLDIDRLKKIEIRHDQVYQPLLPGIDAEHYSAYDSEKDERQWPPQRWRISEDEQIELWPIPDSDFNSLSLEGRVKLTGVKRLSPLVDDGDRADLDDRLIILYCAAEHLAGTGAKDANFKLQQAQKRLATLRGHQAPRRQFRLFGPSSRADAVKRVPLAVYNKPSP